MLASGQLRARQHVLALTYDTWLAAFVDVAVGLFVEKPSLVWRVRNSLAPNVSQFCIDLIERPPSKGWNEYGLYI